MFADFIDTVVHLRHECPWDQKQTHSSLRKHLLEEAYETLEAIDQMSEALAAADPQRQSAASRELRDELGDLLYQVFFHSLLAEERGAFDIAAVVAAINAKLIRRHPHVFGDLEVSSEEELAPHWEAIKQQESSRESVMDGIPSALPALLYAAKVQRKAASQGAKPPDNLGQTDGQTDAETPETSETASLSPDENEAAIGQQLFELVALANQSNIDCEAALRRAATNFKDRFQELELGDGDVDSAAGRDYIWGSS